jgi:hypothetical protein
MERNQDETDHRDAPIRGSSLETNGNSAKLVRDSGLRRLRRMSNWSLGALVVGVGATTGALASTIPGPTTGTTAVTNPAGVTSSASGVAAPGPSVTVPVATTSASGVTTSVPSISGGTVPTGGNGRAFASGSGDS